MSNPKFEIGDWVEYEVDANSRPTWTGSKNMRKIRSPPFKQIRAVVSEITETRIITAVNGVDHWSWGLPGHTIYSPDQWDRPGFIRKVGAAPETTTEECRCNAFDLTFYGHDEKCKWKNRV